MAYTYDFDGLHMPFGVHEGVDIPSLPDNYLKFLLKNPKMGRPVRMALLREAHYRWPDEFQDPDAVRGR